MCLGGGKPKKQANPVPPERRLPTAAPEGGPNGLNPNVLGMIAGVYTNARGVVGQANVGKVLLGGGDGTALPAPSNGGGASTGTGSDTIAPITEGMTPDQIIKHITANSGGPNAGVTPFIVNQSTDLGKDDASGRRARSLLAF